MAYVKKISGEQFALDCINKQWEIIGEPLHFDTWEDLVSYGKEHPKWFSESEYKTPEQFQQWKDYFFEHFYDWKPKHFSKRAIKREFLWFNLMYGLKYGYDPLRNNRD